MKNLNASAYLRQPTPPVGTPTRRQAESESTPTQGENLQRSAQANQGAELKGAPLRAASSAGPKAMGPVATPSLEGYRTPMTSERTSERARGLRGLYGNAKRRALGPIVASMLAAACSAAPGEGELEPWDATSEQEQPSITVAGIPLSVNGIDAYSLPQACSDSSTLKMEFPSGCDVTELSESESGRQLLMTLDYTGTYTSSDADAYLKDLEGVIDKLSSLSATFTSSGTSATVTVFKAETIKIDASALPTVQVTYSATPELPAEDGAVVMYLEICNWRNKNDCQAPPASVIDAINGMGGISLLAPYDSNDAVPVKLASDGGMYVPRDASTAGAFYIFECTETNLADWQKLSAWAMPLWGGLTDGCPGSLASYTGPATTSSQALLARDEAGDGGDPVEDGGVIHAYWFPEGQDYRTNCRNVEIPAHWTWAKQTSAYVANICYPEGE